MAIRGPAGLAAQSWAAAHSSSEREERIAAGFAVEKGATSGLVCEVLNSSCSRSTISQGCNLCQTGKGIAENCGFQLKRSDVRAIVLCNAPRELAQGAVAFSVDLSACASRCTCGRSLQAPFAPGIPVLFCFCTVRDCRVPSAVRLALRTRRESRAVFVRLRFFRHVRFQAERPSTLAGDRFCKLIEALFAPRDNGHCRALRRERPRGGFPDAAARAGDQRHCSIKSFCHDLMPPDSWCV